MDDPPAHLEESNGADSTEWDAQGYHRLADPQYSWGLEVLGRLPLRGDEIVIDAGCGTGRLTARLLDRLPAGRVIALDRSENMLTGARTYLVPRFGAKVRFVRSDLLDLALDRVADAILSTATFHWVLDHPRLFRNLYRALKPAGRLIAQCGGAGNLARELSRANVLLNRLEYRSSFAGWEGAWEFADSLTTRERLRAAAFSRSRPRVPRRRPPFPAQKSFATSSRSSSSGFI